MVAEQPDWVKSLDRLHLLTPLRIVIVLVVAVVLSLVVRVVIRRLLTRTLGLGIPGVDPARNDARQKSLAGALRSMLVGVSWSIVVVVVVSELGVNIGAFIATATVIGGAVAFGAQQVVRDLLAGVYVLAEDQFGVGDVVDLGHVTGTVERITMRAARVRDAEGVLWTVPHGGVARVANMSKSGVASLELHLHRSSSLERAMQEAEALCTALAADGTAAPHLLGPAVVGGLTDLRDDRLVVRLSVPVTVAGREVVRRTWRALAHEAFHSGRLQAPPTLP